MNIKQLLIAVCFSLIACAVHAEQKLNFKLCGFTETVFIVPDAELAAQFYVSNAGWEIKNKAPVDKKLKQLWQLPEKARIKQILVGNIGEERGYVRLIEIQNVAQKAIRANTQSWDTGGIFDVNVRVTDMAKKSAELQQSGWFSTTPPQQFTFGPFVVKEWITKDVNGVAFALIERLQPTLEGWPNLKAFSRVFNSTQVVKDVAVSRHFYEKILGFKPYLEHKGASKVAGPNILGLPHNLTTQIERSVYILHPEGKNEGSVEVLQFHGATGEDRSHLASPPNLGIVTLRFPTNNLKALHTHLQNNQVEIVSKTQLDLPPYGLVDMLAIRTPDNTWLEFYQKIN